MEAHQFINQSSGDVEYYTPVEIIEAARRVMGGIDLDPASSAKANEIVKATRFFTVSDDGLSQPWRDRVWLNHPFGRAEAGCGLNCGRDHEHHGYELYGNAAWINYLENSYFHGPTIQACCITFASTSEAWFQPLMKRPQCYLTPCTNYRLADGSTLKGVSKGSVVTCYGNNVERFAQEYSPFGAIKVKYHIGVFENEEIGL